MRILLTRVFLGLFLLIVAAVVYEEAADYLDQARRPPGNRFDVGGFQMHLRETGRLNAGPTVVLEALSGGFSPYWGWVQAQLESQAHVVSYDRAGRGWSDTGPGSGSLTQIAENLHRLLKSADVPAPYILVGHSIGGLYVRKFQALYPEEVAGVVLLDSAHPEQFRRDPSLLKGNQQYLDLANVFPWAAQIGISRLFFAFGGEMDFAALKEPEKSQVKQIWSTPRYFVNQKAEVAVGPALFQEALSLGSLGNLPLTVISAVNGHPDNWLGMQQELAGLSKNSTFIRLPSATHTSLIFDQQHASLVSQAILDTVRSAQKNGLQR